MRLNAVFGFLWNRFEERCYWWELSEIMLRKLPLLLIDVAIDDAVTKMAVGCATTAYLMALNYKYAPYVKPRYDYLDQAVTAAQLGFFVIGIIIEYREEAKDGGSSFDREGRFEDLAIAFCVIVLLSAFLSFILDLRDFRHDARLERLRAKVHSPLANHLFDFISRKALLPDFLNSASEEQLEQFAKVESLLERVRVAKRVPRRSAGEKMRAGGYALLHSRRVLPGSLDYAFATPGFGKDVAPLLSRLRGHQSYGQPLYMWELLEHDMSSVLMQWVCEEATSAERELVNSLFSCIAAFDVERRITRQPSSSEASRMQTINASPATVEIEISVEPSAEIEISAEPSAEIEISAEPSAEIEPSAELGGSPEAAAPAPAFSGVPEASEASEAPEAPVDVPLPSRMASPHMRKASSRSLSLLASVLGGRSQSSSLLTAAGSKLTGRQLTGNPEAEALGLWEGLTGAAEGRAGAAEGLTGAAEGRAGAAEGLTGAAEGLVGGAAEGLTSVAEGLVGGAAEGLTSVAALSSAAVQLAGVTSAGKAAERPAGLRHWKALRKDVSRAVLAQLLRDSTNSMLHELLDACYCELIVLTPIGDWPIRARCEHLSEQLVYRSRHSGSDKECERVIASLAMPSAAEADPDQVPTPVGLCVKQRAAVRVCNNRSDDRFDVVAQRKLGLAALSQLHVPVLAAVATGSPAQSPLDNRSHDGHPPTRPPMSGSESTSTVRLDRLRNIASRIGGRRAADTNGPELSEEEPPPPRPIDPASSSGPEELQVVAVISLINRVDSAGRSGVPFERNYHVNKTASTAATLSQLRGRVIATKVLERFCAAQAEEASSKTASIPPR